MFPSSSSLTASERLQTIAVIGATGVQGGSVAYALLKTKQWHVRAITRNRSSKAAQALVVAGAEVVVADTNDEESLVLAFRDVQAIFAVTNFWEHLFMGSTQTEAGEKELAQGINLAMAAAKTPTLQHYLWSTMAPASIMTDGKFPCPHWDYKAKVDEFVRAKFPGLAARTTFMMFGWYPSNLAVFPMCKVLPVGAGDVYVWPQPCAASTLLTISGDMQVNPGIWARQILTHPHRTKGKYITVATEVMSMQDILKVWSEVCGKKGVYLHISGEAYEEMWGPAGAELATQLRFNEAIRDWEAFRKADFVKPEEIGIDDKVALGLRKALENMGDRLV